MHEPTTVANYLIKESARRGIELTPLSLQKLLYYVHGHAYSRLGRGAVNEPFEAWKYGPVIPSLYRYLRGNGSDTIEGPIFDFMAEDLESADPELARVAEMVLDTYGGYDGGQLVELTHRVGTPWRTTVQRYKGMVPLGAEIPDSLIREYFVERDVAR